MKSLFARSLLWVGLALLSLPSFALTQEAARAIATGEADERIAALDKAATSVDPGLAPFIQAMLDDAVKVGPQQVVIVRDDKAVDAATGALAKVPAESDDVVNNNRMRRALESALAALRLFSPDVGTRAKAIEELKDQIDEGKLPLLEKAYAAETDAKLKSRLGQLRSIALISSSDADKRLAAAKDLSASPETGTRADRSFAAARRLSASLLEINAIDRN